MRQGGGWLGYPVTKEGLYHVGEMSNHLEW